MKSGRRTTAPVRVCDICRRQAAVRYLDEDRWACAMCAHVYLVQLQLQG